MKLFQPFERAHGIDISDFMIRVAEARHGKKGIELFAFGEVPLAKGIIEKGEITDFEAMKKQLTLLYKSCAGHLSSPFAIVAVPERKTFTKVIEIDTLPHEQLQEAMRWESEQHFPISTEDVYTAWSMISETKEKQTILLSATDRLYVEQYVSALESVGKTLVIAEPESLAMQRFLLADDKTPTIILDLGASKTSADIIVGGIIRYTSTIAFSGKDLTLSLAKKLNLDETQAEKAKTLFGMDKVKSKGVVRKILTPLFNPLLGHLQQILSYYEDHFSNLPKIERICLCGGGSTMAGIDEFLSEQVSLPVTKIIPKIRGSYKAGRHFDQSKVLSFVTVIGLSLRSGEQLPYQMLK